MSTAIRAIFTLSRVFMFVMCLAAGKTMYSQAYIAPQLYNNLDVSWGINDKWSLYNQFSYNVILSDAIKWNETALFSISSYNFHNNIEALASVYLTYVNQSEILSSFEFRPAIGIRFFRSSKHRFVISNFTRLEFRSIYYSDDTNDFTIRLRNRTSLFLALTKPIMNSNKNLFLFGFGELYYNFDNATRERFYNLLRMKLGIGYRLNLPWRFTAGVIYQNTQSNIGEIGDFTTNVITNLIIEWQVLYFIPTKGTK
jgi:hypothetical protein